MRAAAFTPAPGSEPWVAVRDAAFADSEKTARPTGSSQWSSPARRARAGPRSTFPSVFRAAAFARRSRAPRRKTAPHAWTRVFWAKKAANAPAVPRRSIYRRSTAAFRPGLGKNGGKMKRTRFDTHRKASEWNARDPSGTFLSFSAHERKPAAGARKS